MSGHRTPQLLILPARGRLGRPLRAEAASAPVQTRLSPAELKRVERAASVNHQNISQFVRDAIVTAAEDCLDPNNS